MNTERNKKTTGVVFPVDYAAQKYKRVPFLERGLGQPFLQPRGFSRVARNRPNGIERKRGQAKRRPCEEIPKNGFPRKNIYEYFSTARGAISLSSRPLFFSPARRMLQSFSKNSTGLSFPSKPRAEVEVNCN